MSEVGNSTRTGALLPTTPILEQAWDHTTMNGRRLLPSPGPKKVNHHLVYYFKLGYSVFNCSIEHYLKDFQDG